MTISSEARAMAAKVEAFVRGEVFAYEADPRRDHHGAPTDDLVMELRDKARAAGVLTPHVRPDGSHFNQRETAVILIASGLSPLGPLACNTMAPDEGNMYLLGKVGNDEMIGKFGEGLKLGILALVLQRKSIAVAGQHDIALMEGLKRAAVTDRYNSGCR